MEIKVFAVLMPPTNERNPSSPISPTILVEMIAACEEPKPGRKAAIKPTPEAAEMDLIMFFLEIVSGLSFCLGILEFWRRLSTKIEKPNKPESNGNKGWCRLGMLKISKPRAPASRKTTKLLILF